MKARTQHAKAFDYLESYRKYITTLRETRTVRDILEVQNAVAPCFAVCFTLSSSASDAIKKRLKIR